MSLDTSIDNVGEYYSSHYLSSTFSKDVKNLIAQWRQQGTNATPRRVQQLSQRYFRAKTQALEEGIPADRWRAADDLAALHAHLLENLGFTERIAVDIPVEGAKTVVPAVARIKRYNRPWLVICETIFCLPETSLKDGMPSEDPLEMMPLAAQLKEADNQICGGNWSRLIGRVFTEEDAPRWVIFLAGSRVLLLDKHTFAQGRYLAFDFDDAFGRGVKVTFDHFAAFLSAQTLCPDGQADDLLHDTLETNSHKFAHGVTENLQWAVREAIGELANAWVDDRRRRQISFTRRMENELLPDGSDEITAEHLRHEALIFVYRLLFCFYAEARGGELEILPITDDAYRLGYSLESLRDLEQVPLTAATEQGSYFHDHLRILFQIIHNGFNPRQSPPFKTGQSLQQAPLFEDKQRLRQQGLFGHSDAPVAGFQSRAFAIRPLTATLFDPAGTPLLNNARLSNGCLQKVIRNLSLSRDEKNKSIGRVNYAELGINQLGAVYEGLLSYKGMFAKEDLIQVKPPKGDFKDKKTPTWFVPATRLDEFRNEKEKNIVERVRDGKPRIYKQGTFILHLSGIDREQSASYYTPEVLTKCLVEEALRELLKDYTPADADKILKLKICEPAMGSGAFLNEAADQLAHHYLDLKQKQTGVAIEPGRYLDELRRVKHYITTRNVYGVDLNPTAVELGALSLWLGSIHRLLVKTGENGEPDRYQSGATPWFGLRLRCGNSLIGVRRAVWTDEQLREKRHFGKNSEIPRLLKPGEPRRKNEIYHFLVFDEEMVPTHKDKLMRQFWPESCEAAKRWHGKETKNQWDQEEIAEALRICERIDVHWKTYTRQRLQALETIACTATVWPQPSSGPAARTESPTLAKQEQIRAALEADSGSFQRLKLVMDAWCSLWFWPLDKVESLPTRKSFLSAAGLLLGDRPPEQAMRPLLSANLGFEIDALLKVAGGSVPDTQQLADTVFWFSVCQTIALKQHFHHWELIFTEILGNSAPDSGFDLVLGNPPWIPVDWKEAPTLYEMDPLLGVKTANSAELKIAAPKLMDSNDEKQFYSSKFINVCGVSTYLTNKLAYLNLAGMRTNLYKNFIIRSSEIINNKGIGALLHPEGVYDDPQGMKFRSFYYKRLVAHYHFQNWLPLFKDVKSNRNFSINIFKSKAKDISFENLSYLIHPKTLIECRTHEDVHDPIPGLKKTHGGWNLKGHCKRFVTISIDVLRIYAKLFEEENSPAEFSRLLQVHNTNVLNVLSKLSMPFKSLSSMSRDYFYTMMFNETLADRSGLISKIRGGCFRPVKSDDMILSMSHMYVANPLCRTTITDGSDQEIDLTEMDDNFLPCTKFKPIDVDGYLEKYDSKISFNKNIKEKLILKHKYKYCNRTRAQQSDARTLISAILPRGSMHIDSLFSIIFNDDRKMVLFSGFTHSICCDFLIKTTGKDHCRHDIVGRLPIIEGPYNEGIINRTLRLNCLTKNYSDLWKESSTDLISNEIWTRNDPKLSNPYEYNWEELNPNEWKTKSPLRSDYSRRQALLEIDVLTALSFGLKLEELLAIYWLQFPTLQSYERIDEYDSRGILIPNTTRKSKGGKEVREARKNWHGKSPLTVSWPINKGLQTVTKTFFPPFTGVDREADYEKAFMVFSERYANE